MEEMQKLIALATAQMDQEWSKVKQLEPKLIEIVMDGEIMIEKMEIAYKLLCTFGAILNFREAINLAEIAIAEGDC